MKDLHDKATEASTYAFNQKRSLSNEIKAVQDQKDDALRYEQLVLQRMDLISEQVMWKLFHIEKEAKEVSASIDKLHEQVEIIKKEETSGDLGVKEQRKALAKIQKDSLSVEKQVKKAQSEADSIAPEVLEIDEKYRYVQSKVKGLEGSLEKQKICLKKTETDISVIETQLNELTETQNLFEKTSEAKLSAHQLPQNLLEKYQKLKENANEQCAGERLQVNALEHELTPILSTLKQKNEKIDEFKARLAELETEKEPLEGKRRELANEVGTAQDERKSIQRELLRNQTERTKLQQAEVEANENLRGCMEKLLQAKIDREEGERELKLRATVESLRRMFPGVSGRLVDLCQPTGKKFDTALTVVLGRHLDSIVVDCEQTAIDCIQYMRRQRAGQATFIPLDTIQSRPVSEKWRTFTTGARPAIDVLSFESQFTRAFQYACGNTLVCDTLDIAKYVCYARSQKVKAVTVDGTVIHKNGFLTGGSSVSLNNGKADSRRWEEKDVTRLKSDRDALLVTLADISKSLKKFEGDQKLRTSLTEKEGRIEFLSEEIEALDRLISSNEAESVHVSKDLKKLEQECSALTRSIQKQTVQFEALKQSIASKTESVFAEFCAEAKISSISAYEESQTVVRREINEKLSKFTGVSAKLSNQLTFLKRQREEIQAQIDEVVQSIQTESKVFTRLTKEKDSCDSKVGDKRRVLQDLLRRQEELKGALGEASELVDSAKRSNQRFSSELTRLGKEISSLECEIEKKLEVRYSLLKKCRLEEIDLPLAKGSLTDISLEGDHSSDSLSGMIVDYTVLGKEARSRRDDSYESTYTDKIRELGEKIEALIPNLRALDKLESVEARLKGTLESFEAARADAKKARDDFLVIRTRRQRAFNSAFKHISEAIDPIYKELTRSEAVPTGGTAYLSLEDADEPYLEGIKYHAMPPMKRFLDMEQLSGGERTVAALALLFAIHSYRPAPFFILDEIDAALDNANVQRVASFIRAKSPSTQFIVISLKGSLYEKAESLIGIYRDPEEISSKILSLKLSEYPE